MEPLDLLAERRASHDFRWASRSWPGVPYFVRGELKSPKQIVQAVMENQAVQKVIREQAKEKKAKEEDICKQAKETLLELAHDYHMYAIRWFAVMLSKLAKRLYNSIQVDVQKLNEIKRAYSSYPVLLLPTHRSYVDFLLVSYLSFSFDLTLPIIAAGMDFKGMIGVGEFLRKSGAFYIRRRFGGDPLYWALISEYVKTAVLEGGHPLEMFVEGTRSRTGKSLKPKIGLLSIILELVSSGQIPNILILPISMSYDRTLEERLYAHELLGQPKPKESTNGLMKALKWLGSQSYGSVYVNFGNLISVREMLEAKSNPVTSIRAEQYLKSVQEIALKVVLDQQANLVVPIIGGISLIVISELARNDAFAMPLKSLLQRLEFLQFLLNSRHSRFGYPLMRESLESNVRYIISVHPSLLSITTESPGGDLVVGKFASGDSIQLMVFQHYTNQILNNIFPLCIVALLDQVDNVISPLENANKDSSISNSSSEVEGNYIFMREVFQEDFLYETSTIRQELEWALTLYNSLKDASKCERVGNTCRDGSFESSTAEYGHFCELQILRRALEPYFMSYWGVAKKLEEITRINTATRYEMKEFGISCQNFLTEEMNSGKIINAYGALSLETISNALSSFVRFSALERVKMENGSFGIVVRDSCRLTSISNRFDRLVGGDWQRNGNTEKHSGWNAGKTENAGAISCDQVQLQLRSKL